MLTHLSRLAIGQFVVELIRTVVGEEADDAAEVREVHSDGERLGAGLDGAAMK